MDELAGRIDLEGDADVQGAVQNFMAHSEQFCNDPATGRKKYMTLRAEDCPLPTHATRRHPYSDDEGAGTSDRHVKKVKKAKQKEVSFKILLILYVPLLY